MASEEISKKFQGLKLGNSQDINILLLGETGVGKSTFINAIANYLHFKNFKKAAKAEDLLILIPTIFSLTDKNLQRVEIKVGSDNNEFQEVGAAGTQDVKTYVFPLGEGQTKLRLIDSPGMGDPRGIEQDDINCENILAYLSQLYDLHAICFLMKTTTTRITVYFEYCVKEILSRLEKSASKNIIFIFTNARGSNYTPGDTLSSLKVVLDDIKSKPPHVDIPLTNDNTFSVDNEAFRYLVAMKKNVQFNEEVEARFVESWNNSSKECWRLISYIVGDISRDGLAPHQLTNTMSINEARRMIVQLSQPLADISQLIYDNLRILDRHQANLAIENQSLDELKKKLYIPFVNLEVTQLTQPVTVCTSTKCSEIIKVEDIQTWHYRQRCHDPCYLTNVDKEIVGHPGLLKCAAMNSTRICHKCTCDFSVHMHVYYLTKPVEAKIVDENIKGNIHVKEEALQESQRLIREINNRKRELEEERDTIIKGTAQFAHFLQHNAISPFNDSYKAYIEYLIIRERSLGVLTDKKTILNLQQLLQQYEEIKEAFETSLQMNQQLGLHAVINSTVTAKSVIETIHKLYKLKHNGKKIHELMKKQKASRTSEHNKTCEYIHPKSSEPYKPKKEKKGAVTDEEKGNKKKNSKPKGYATTDDEKKTKPTKTKQRVPQQSRQSNYQRREPPPPYPGHPESKITKQTKYEEDQADVVVRVELNRPDKKQKRPNEQNQQAYDPYAPGPHDPALYGQNPYHPPPNYPGQYYQAPPSPNYYPQHGQAYPPPPNQYGPPGQYPPPPNPYGPPPHQYGAPLHHYRPPPTPPYPQYGAPHHLYDQRPNQRPNQQNYRGRPNDRRGHNNARGKSKQREYVNKQKEKKSGKSSSSDYD